MRYLVVALVGWTAIGAAQAEERYREAIAVVRSLADDAVVGEVILRDSPYGMLVIPSLTGLTPGPHATHVHEKPNCGPGVVDGKEVPGGAAGGHYDPAGTGQYLGPYAEGALGDLPNLLVEADGRAVIPVLAPRVRVEDVARRSIMIHAGADRYGPTFPTSGTMDDGSGSHAMAHAGMNTGTMDTAPQTSPVETAPMAMAPMETEADAAMAMAGAAAPGDAMAVEGQAGGPAAGATAPMAAMPMDAPANPAATGEMAPPGPHGGMRMYCGLIGPASTGVTAFPD